MKIFRSLTIATLCFASILKAAAGDAAPLHVQGFASFGYLKSSHYNYLASTEEGDSDFAEIGLNFAYYSIDRTAIKGQLFAFELGQYGNYDPQIDYLFLDYSFDPKLGIRIGRVKRIAGLYTDTQNIDVARTSILLPNGIYDSRHRDFNAYVDGLALYGSFRNNQKNLFDYTLYAGKKDVDIDGGMGGITHTLMSWRFDDVRVTKLDSTYNLGGQIWWHTPIENLRIGYSQSYFPDIAVTSEGRFPAGTQPAFLVGQSLCNELDTDLTASHLSFEYFTGDWTFAAELYQQLRDSEQYQTIGNLPVQRSHLNKRADGWHITASRRLFERFQLGTTYTEFYADTTNRDGSGTPVPHSLYSKDLQISFQWDISENLLFKLESHQVRGTSQLFNQRNQNPNLSDRSWNLWAAKTTITF